MSKHLSTMYYTQYIRKQCTTLQQLMHSVLHDNTLECSVI